ncbi:D-alanine--poly(phosphoribitol) ligase subunit 1 [Clostridia bacterium]|nr:D-alanine--poly(phosphoribitol) ligase subunit 1 [Clostridia bacterium]
MDCSAIIKKIRDLAGTAPDTVCFQRGSDTFTYGELIRRADVLTAEWLRRFPGRDPLLCFGSLDFEMIVGFLACIQSSRPYIPVDASMPADRVKTIRDTSGCCGIWAAAPWPFEEESLPVFSAEEFGLLPLVPAGENDRQPVTGDDIFYIIYTSGTTGLPKGVQISYHNLTGFVAWILSDFGLGEGRRFLLQAPFSFDLSVMSLWPALVSGGTLVTIGKDAITDFKRLYSEIPELGLQVWVSTPSFADLCLADPGFHEENNPQIRHFLFCGDELLHRTAEKLAARFPGARIFNTYGPTEATVAVTQVEIDSKILETYERLPVGTAKPDTQIEILNEAGLPSPDGVAGEIVIAGPAVSAGYRNDPERTAEVFFRYNDLPAYHTGDAGVMENGMLFFKGRLDFQIKFHGYRIELQDIEQHLLKNPLIADALAVPIYKDFKVFRIVAYLVAAAHDFESEYELSKSIKKTLAKSVPDYMVPQKFVFVDKLPLTVNGKVDRKRVTEEVNPA